MTDSEFDWYISDDVIVPEQRAIAIYTNEDGAVVIRQEGLYGPDEDQVIWFEPRCARTIADAILEAAELDDEPPPLANTHGRGLPTPRRRRTAAMTTLSSFS